MPLNRFAFACLLGLAVSALARAETVTCPDLKTVVQVGSCPTEDELQYTYVGYCSEDSRAYRQETGVCVDYQDYRKLKNVALWETGDGRFHAYVSCDTPAATVRAAKPARLVVLAPRRGERMNRLTCDYAGGVQFTLRTHAECRVSGDGVCAAGTGKSSGCEAICEATDK